MDDRIRLGAVLLFFTALFFWGNAALPATAPVEVNYAQTAKEMLAAGNYLSPQIYGNYWYDKPIFFYWELIAAFSVFGVTDFAARFFPALFASAGLLLTYALARRLYDARTAFWSVVILGSCVLYGFLAKLILTDLTLFVFFGGTLGAFYLGYREGRRGYFYLAYACAGLGVLTKGPVGFLLPGLVILVYLAVRQQTGGLQDQQRRCHHQEGARLVEVPGCSLRPDVADELVGHLGQGDLGDVQAVLADQLEQQVERPLEVVEVDRELLRGRC